MIKEGVVACSTLSIGRLAMCKRSCCPGKDTGTGLGTAIIAVSLAIMAIVVLRVIETILWWLIIAAGITVVTVLVAGLVMAWYYLRSPARGGVTVVPLPHRPPYREVTGGISGAGKNIAVQRQLDKIAAEAGGLDRVRVIVIDGKGGDQAVMTAADDPVRYLEACFERCDRSVLDPASLRTGPMIQIKSDTGPCLPMRVTTADYEDGQRWWL
jgi:hypothetical protein